jgi:hypothetical protein
MRMYFNEKDIKTRIRVSAESLARLDDTLVVPLYAVGELTRLRKGLQGEYFSP